MDIFLIYVIFHESEKCLEDAHGCLQTILFLHIWSLLWYIEDCIGIVSHCFKSAGVREGQGGLQRLCLCLEELTKYGNWQRNSDWKVCKLKKLLFGYVNALWVMLHLTEVGRYRCKVEENELGEKKMGIWIIASNLLAGEGVCMHTEVMPMQLSTGATSNVHNSLLCAG